MINSGEVTILCTGLFPHEYKEWRKIHDHERTWEKFQDFWSQAWDTKNMHNVTAAQVGYGNNIGVDTVPDHDATIYQDAMNNFAHAHAANSEAFQTLSSTNASLNTNLASGIQALQAQMNALTDKLQRLSTSAPESHPNQWPPQQTPPPHNYHPQPPTYPPAHIHVPQTYPPAGKKVDHLHKKKRN